MSNNINNKKHFQLKNVASSKTQSDIKTQSVSCNERNLLKNNWTEAEIFWRQRNATRLGIGNVSKAVLESRLKIRKKSQHSNDVARRAKSIEIGV